MDIAIRTIVLYFFVIVVMRVVGRRELSSLTAVDLILLIVMGDAIQQGLTQDDYSVSGAVIVISTFAVLQVATAYLGFRFRRVRRVLEGDPVVLIDDGKLVEANLRRHRLTPDDVAEEMRLQQIMSFGDVRWGILEANGRISFIERRSLSESERAQSS
ncbi:MAG TPA: YetF domain-containing protein [Mycobacteriales bacterium]|nr:YetF domain-containing protein [Mycobacteriales bacterium]